MNFEQFLIVLWARRKMVWHTLLGVVAVTLVVSLLIPSKYTATSAVLVDAKSPDPIAANDRGYLSDAALRTYLATQVDIITSDRVAESAVKLLKLDQDPKLIQDWRDATDGKGQLVGWIAKSMEKKLEVKPVHDSSVINITYTGDDPVSSAATANAFANAYINTSLELKVDPARRYAGWFEERLKTLRGSLEQAQARLSDYQQKTGIIATDDRLDSKIAELSSQLVLALGQTADSQSKQKYANGTMQEVLQNPVIQTIKAELVKQEGQLQQLGRNLGKNHPQYQAQENQIAELRQRLNAETGQIMGGISTANRVNKQKENELRAAIESTKKVALGSKKQRDQLAVLQRDVDAAQKAYDTVAQHVSQTSLEGAANQTNIAVLTMAAEPTNPSSPKIFLNLMIAAVLGLLLGVASAFVMEALDQRVRTIEDLEASLGLPVLAQIQRPQRLLTNGQRLLMLKG